MPLAKLSMFDALPPYFGGKRRLLGHIFRELPPPSEAPLFADAFLGGGAVSLFAKARGYQVLCNDLAERSVLVGRALVENDRVRLGSEDALRLFAGDAGEPGFMETHHAPTVVTTRHARFLDGAIAATAGMEEPKRSLSRLLLVKYLFRLRPMGNFGAKTITEQVEDGRFDELNPTFLRGDYLARVHAHPKRHVDALVEQLGRGVFGGAGECRAHQLDAMEFVRAIEADVLYLDPPYGDGTLAYETALRVVDEMLQGRRINPERSAFSQACWKQALAQLLDAAQHIPVVALSFGSVSATLEELVELMRRFRPDVTGHAIHYAHCASLASEESRARNHELLIIGRGKR